MEILRYSYRVEKTPRQWYMSTSHDQISASLVVSARGDDRVQHLAASQWFSYCLQCLRELYLSSNSRNGG
jgi:hypothetical protein